MIELKQEPERVILVSVSTGSEEDAAASLHELKELARTAGAVAVCSVLQNREAPHPGTYVGRGKLEELRQMLELYEADGVICDDELSPAQMNNLAEELQCKVMDRTLLILDIFAGRARSSEGKVQVELAQLRYRKERLTGLGKSLSRLGGGIGTRGPGEKKLEMDRRLINSRISILRGELEEIRRHRELIRHGREAGLMKTAALVGYTNAGKSTLLNALTGADVFAEDSLFATLDPTTRALDLPLGGQILLTDTVGFIHKLPHHLIDAFRSTLEEAVYADIIVHVVDAADPRMDQHMHVVYETLRQLGASGSPVITLFNKQDLIGAETSLKDLQADVSLKISAKNGSGLQDLIHELEHVLLNQQVYIERLYPYTESGKIALIRRQGKLLSEEFLPEGTKITAYIPRELVGAV